MLQKVVQNAGITVGADVGPHGVVGGPRQIGQPEGGPASQGTLLSHQHEQGAVLQLLRGQTGLIQQFKADGEGAVQLSVDEGGDQRTEFKPVQSDGNLGKVLAKPTEQVRDLGGQGAECTKVQLVRQRHGVLPESGGGIFHPLQQISGLPVEAGPGVCQPDHTGVPHKQMDL